MTKKAEREESRREAVETLRTRFAICSKYVREYHYCVTCGKGITKRAARGTQWSHDGSPYEPAHVAHPKRESKPKVYANVTHVSRSGMSRQIEFYVIIEGELQRISHDIATVTGWPLRDNGVTVSGCGMDMGFHTLDVIARSIGLESIHDGNDFDLRYL